MELVKSQMNLIYSGGRLHSQILTRCFLHRYYICITAHMWSSGTSSIQAVDSRAPQQRAKICLSAKELFEGDGRQQDVLQLVLGMPRNKPLWLRLFKYLFICSSSLSQSLKGAVFKGRWEVYARFSCGRVYIQHLLHLQGVIQMPERYKSVCI